MEEIDALNSWKPDLGHETGNCGPQKSKIRKKKHFFHAQLQYDTSPYSYCKMYDNYLFNYYIHLQVDGKIEHSKFSLFL